MYRGKKVIHIVAKDLNGGIGCGGDLLFSVKEDLEFFKNSTIGHALIMGRKTFESLPSKLGRRVTLVATNMGCDGYQFAGSLSEAIDEAWRYSEYVLNTSEIFIAGGGEIYKQTENIVDEVWATEIHTKAEGVDTFYRIPEGFEVDDVGKTMRVKDRKSGTFVLMNFVKYKRLTKS